MSLYNYSVNKAVAAVNRAINFSGGGEDYIIIEDEIRRQYNPSPLKRILTSAFNNGTNGALLGAGIGALVGKKGEKGASALKGLKRGALIGTGLGALAGGINSLR